MFEAMAVMAGSQLFGGMMGADAAEDAAAAQGQASAASIGEQRRQFDLSRKDSGPYREVGSAGVRRLSDLLGLSQAPASGLNAEGINRYRSIISRLEDQKASGTDSFGNYNPLFDQHINEARNALTGLGGDMASGPVSEVGADQYGSLNKQFTVGDFYKDPVTELSMKYGLDLGTKGINQGASAGGMRRSGQTLKALSQFGTDYAGSKAGESRDRFYGDQDRIYNRLAGVSGVGQTATANQNQLGAQFAGNIGNTMTAQGNARGAAGIAKSNAWNNSFSNVGQWWNQDQNMKRMMAMQGGGLPGIADEMRLT